MKNASQIFSSINRGVIELKINKGQNRLNNNSQGKKKNSPYKSIEPFYKMDLIVNAEPDLPLRVPIDSQSMNFGYRAENLKNKNL